jgi:hypothetical protein
MYLASTNCGTTSLEQLAESPEIVFPRPDGAWLVKCGPCHHGTARLQVMGGRDRKIAKGERTQLRIYQADEMSFICSMNGGNQQRIHNFGWQTTGLDEKIIRILTLQKYGVN